MSKKLKSLITLTAVGFGTFTALKIRNGDENFYKNFIMPLVHKIDPEKAHRLAVLVSKYRIIPKSRYEDKDTLKVNIFGKQFSNPIGIAAGFDKDGEAIQGLQDIGFGFVEIGSVTPLPQPGNYKPRVFRLTEDGAVINRYGFNSQGHDVVFKRIEDLRKNASESIIIGVNLGKNKTSNDPIDDYVRGINKFGAVADYLVINVSSPNTPGLRDMQHKQNLVNLLSALVETRDKLPVSRKPPLLLKLAPDLTMREKEDIADVLRQKKCRVDGLIISNTTIDRPASLQSRYKCEAGGLSGKPLKDVSTDMIRDMRRLTDGEPLVDTLKKAGQELGYTLLSGENPFSPLGYVEIPLTVENGTRLNAAKAFLGKIKERTNLFVALNAFVTRINIDQTTKTAQGVEVQIGEKTFQIDARKEVILSAGAINSPQLLILSGIGPRPHLGDLGIPVVQDLPVGENLQDHLTVVGFNVRLNPNAVKNSSEGYILDEVYKYFRYRTGTFATLSSSNLVAFINTKIDSDFPNVEIVHFLSSLETNYAALNLLVKTGVASPSDLQHILDRAEGYPVLHFRPVLMKPKSRGKILLKSSNPYDHPSIDAGFYTDEDNEDLETLLEGVRYLEKMLETEAFAKHAPKLIRPKVCQESALGSDEFWRCLITHLTTHLFHQAGTCKMGPEGDRTAVVDPRLRVKGVKNLRVADASIMPVINSGHTNAPCMMIGHKAGVMIAEDWLRQEKHQEL